MRLVEELPFCRCCIILAEQFLEKSPFKTWKHSECRLYCMQGTKGCIFQIREHNTAITKDTDLIASTVSIWFIHVRISKSMFYHHVIEESYIIIKVLAAHCTICQLYQVFYHDYKLWILSNHIFSQIYGQIWQN